jgi:crotonobetainyl-CoA:carnitine CoA-transferase CaiB-like acyl-CoA transferase
MVAPMDTERANNRPQALAGLRVLKVAERVCGPYSGKLLASLGAEVIKAETPPEADPSRRRGPFPGDIPHLERSGTFLYLNTGKKGITLNLADLQGRVLLGELARRVDVIIHDQRPALAARWGLDAPSLSKHNPDFQCSETPPQTGRAPLLGENNRLIYQELGYAPRDIVDLARGGAI